MERSTRKRFVLQTSDDQDGGIQFVEGFDCVLLQCVCVQIDRDGNKEILCRASRLSGASYMARAHSEPRVAVEEKIAEI